MVMTVHLPFESAVGITYNMVMTIHLLFESVG